MYAVPIGLLVHLSFQQRLNSQGERHGASDSAAVCGAPMQGMLLVFSLFLGLYLIAAALCMVMLIWVCVAGDGGRAEEVGSQGQAPRGKHQVPQV
jgi:hypothetical protein